MTFIGFLLGLFIGWLVWRNSSPSRKSSSKATPSTNQRQAIASTLEQLAAQDKYIQEAPVYLELVRSLREDRLPYPQKQIKLHSEETISAEVSNIVTGETATAEDSATSQSHGPDIKQLLQNVNTLLFAGALLIVTSAGILVGSNFEAISDGLRVLLLALFAIAFYVSGQLIFRRPKLKPAGSTFIGIGLVLVPMIGLATQVLLLPDSFRWPTFFLTAITTLFLSIVTSMQVKQHYVQYIAIAAAVSSVQFGLLSLNVEFVYLMWVLLLSGLGLMLLQRSTMAEEYDLSFYLTAQLLVPVAFGVQVILSIQELGWWQMAVSSIFAAIFYHVASLASKGEDGKVLYSAIGLLLWPVATSLLFLEWLGTGSQLITFIGVSLAAWSIIYTVADILETQQQTKLIPSLSFRQTAPVLTIASSVFLLVEPAWLSLMLAVAMIQYFAHYIFRTQQYALFISQVSALLLPPVLFLLAIDIPSASRWALISAFYGLLTILFVLLERGIAGIHFNKEAKQLFKSSIAASFVLTGLSLFGADVVVQAIVLTLLAMSATALGGWYKRTELAAVTVGLSFVAVLCWLEILGIEEGSIRWFTSAVLVGGVFFVTSFNATTEWQQFLKNSSVVVLAMSIFSTDDVLSNIGIYLLALSIGFGRLTTSETWKELFAASAIGLIAVERTMQLNDISELQLYTIPWAVYFAVLAYSFHLREKTNVRDQWMVVSLTALTVPLLLQIFSEPSIGYFGLILVESVMLMVVGVLLRYRLLLWWGLGALLVSTFDRVIRFIEALPNYLLTLIAGITLLVVAIRFLQSRNDE